MDIKKAMENLLRKDIPINTDNFHEEIRASFPPKNVSLLDEQQRYELMQKSEVSLRLSWMIFIGVRLFIR